MGARSSIYSAYGCCVKPDDEMEKRRGTSHVMIQVVGSASLLPLLGLPPTLRQNPKNNAKEEDPLNLSINRMLEARIRRGVRVHCGSNLSPLFAPMHSSRGIRCGA